MLKIKDNDLAKEIQILGLVSVKDKLCNLLYRKLECSFNDEYNETRDMTPVRSLKIRSNKNGEYIIHNHKRYYLEGDK